MKKELYEACKMALAQLTTGDDEGVDGTRAILSTIDFLKEVIAKYEEGG